MSYTETGRPPMLSIEAFSTPLTSGLAVMFQCPRCGRVQIGSVNARDLGEYGEVTLTCNNPKCTTNPDRPGYELCLRLSVESRMLGLNDEPLKP